MLTKVTISGADDNVEIQAMQDLSDEFPFVEWGVLFSETRAGSPRYPSAEWVQRLIDHKVQFAGAIRISAHACGSVAKALMDGRFEPTLRHFDRIQINGFNAAACADLVDMATRDHDGVSWILQARDRRHLDACETVAAMIPNASVLYDPSGGRGVETHEWPYGRRSAEWMTLGYAGGIGSHNIGSILSSWIARAQPADPHPCWIDMESRVRDDDDRLDLERVRMVLTYAAPFIRT